jgi:hypothetical protein
MVRITVAALCFLNTEWTGLCRGNAVRLFWRCAFRFWSRKSAVLSEVARYGVLMAMWLMIQVFRYKTRSKTHKPLAKWQHYVPEDLHDWGFLWFFWVPPSQFWDITLIRQLLLLSKVRCISNLWGTNCPPIDNLESEIPSYREHMKWPTEKDWKLRG